VISGGTSETTGLATTDGSSAFVGPWYSPLDAALNTEANAQVAVGAGTMAGFRAYLNNPPNNGGGTQSYTVTVRKNGADTTITCTMTEAVNTCTSASSVAFASGDLLSVRITAASTSGPVTGGRFSWVATFK